MEEPVSGPKIDSLKPVIHRRVKVSHSVKGIVTTEATFSIDGNPDNMPMFNTQCVEFFDWVDKTWPPHIEVDGR